MATYYKWRKSTVNYTKYKVNTLSSGVFPDTNFQILEPGYEPKIASGQFILQPANKVEAVNLKTTGSSYRVQTGSYFVRGASTFSTDVEHANEVVTLQNSSGYDTYFTGSLTTFRLREGPGTSQGYVYSTNSSAYPNGDVSGGYYYDQRTTVTSPTIPKDVTVPSPITSPTFTVSWTASTSNTNYPVKQYLVQVRMNNATSSPILAQKTVTGTSTEITIPTTYDGAPVTSVNVIVLAQDTNNQDGPGSQISSVPVYLAPTLTVPQMVMQGQQATINWSAIEGADSYTLQRKANTDTDWTQVYSGTALTFSETVGTWTSLQYRVQAVFDGTPGGWATSNSIQIVSASSLVISGQDGDLGTLTSDVPYSISSDQSSPTIDVTVEVNGGEYASFQAISGQTYKVSVLDLPTGTGNIIITATTEVSSSPVTVTRTWTYSKTAQTFPNSGSVAALTKEGNVVYPETLPEAVRTPMNPWGGNLSTALELLKRAALFNRTKQPKYSEVTISMTNVTEGQIIRIPRGGVMVPHYVGKLEYETSLNGTGRRLLVPVNCYDQRFWGPSSVNAWAGSTLLSWENGDYKALFPEEIQTAMGTTTYYYTPGKGNKIVTTRADAVFSLSMTELGFSGDQMNVEGSPLPIANTLKLSGQLQSTRSPRTNGTANVWCVSGTGAQDSQDSGSPAWSRPVFTLPSTFTYGPVYVDNQGTIHNQQEYTEAGNWLDMWGSVIPAVHIETGSYVGTGTSGESNPNMLTFPFEPKIVFIMKDPVPDLNQMVMGFFLCDSLGAEYKDRGYMYAFRGYSNSNNDTALNFPPNSKIARAKIGGNTLNWYSNDSSIQLNLNIAVYHYVALG